MLSSRSSVSEVRAWAFEPRKSSSSPRAMSTNRGLVDDQFAGQVHQVVEPVDCRPGSSRRPWPSSAPPRLGRRTAPRWLAAAARSATAFGLEAEPARPSRLGDRQRTQDPRWIATVRSANLAGHGLRRLTRPRPRLDPRPAGSIRIRATPSTSARRTELSRSHSAARNTVNSAATRPRRAGRREDACRAPRPCRQPVQHQPGLHVGQAADWARTPPSRRSAPGPRRAPA